MFYQGFRGQAGTSTAFPSGLTTAATFDVELMEEWGNAMGEEFFDKGANVQLGPGMCVARVPKNGRNFEYLAGEVRATHHPLMRASQAVSQSRKRKTKNESEKNEGGFQWDWIAFFFLCRRRIDFELECSFCLFVFLSMATYHPKQRDRYVLEHVV